MKPHDNAWEGNADGLTHLLEENKRLRELAERQMNDAEAARLELAELKAARLGDKSREAPDTSWIDREAAPSETERSIEDVVTLPKEPPEAWFRPFIMCPADEVLIAWQAFLKIAQTMRGKL